MAPTTHNWRDDMKAGEYVDKDGDPVTLDDTEDGPAPIEERKELSVQKRPADEVDGLGDREIEFIASTPEEDRDGDIIEQSGIKLGPFKENPVFLYAHRQGMPPVGKVTKAEIRGGQMVARVKFLGPDDVGEFAADHEHVKFAEMLFRLYEGGFMSAVSIGFMAQPGNVEERDDGGFRFKAIEVMELSAVSVQSNRGATAIQRALNSDDGEPIQKIIQSVADTHDLDITTKDAPDGDETPDNGEKSTDKADVEPTETKESRTLSKANEARAIEIVAQGAKMLMDHDENRAMDVLDQIRRGTHPMGDEDGLDDDKSTDGDTSKLGEVEATLTADASDMKAELEEVKGLLEDIKELSEQVPTEAADVDADPELKSDTTADTPDLPVKEFAAKMVTDFLDLPLAARDREWDSEGAVGRWRDFSDSTEEPTDQYRDNFIWVDSEEPGEFESYKLPYGDVIDGTHHAVPRAIFAIAAALQGARGGVDIPESDMDDARAHVEQYYAKARDEFDDDAIIAPWNTEDSLRVWQAKQADALGIGQAPALWFDEKVAPPVPEDGADDEGDKAAEPDETPESPDASDDMADAKHTDQDQPDDAETPAFRLRRTDDKTSDEPTPEHDGETDAPSGEPRIRLNR